MSRRPPGAAVHPEGTNPAANWRRKCEDFASRNGATRACGERGAKRGGRRPLKGTKSGGGNAKILLPGMELQGLAGRGEQRADADGRLGGRNPAAEM